MNNFRANRSRVPARGNVDPIDSLRTEQATRELGRVRHRLKLCKIANPLNDWFPDRDRLTGSNQENVRIADQERFRVVLLLESRATIAP
jgi:hypothetical protein